jgi:hypothetical protein
VSTYCFHLKRKDLSSGARLIIFPFGSPEDKSGDIGGRNEKDGEINRDIPTESVAEYK